MILFLHIESKYAYFYKAYTVTPDCLMSHAVFALISAEDEDQSIVSSFAHFRR